ncbi:MAG: adenosylmethionine decarboxylase [Bdellovibrionia bacterium]
MSLGVHLLIEYENCDRKAINDRELVREKMLESVERSGATIVREVFHTFAPQGVSGVIVIAESHVTVHTWPEHGYAAVDVFTCGDKIKSIEIVNGLKSGFGAKDVHVKKILRGPRASVSSDFKLPSVMDREIPPIK